MTDPHLVVHHAFPDAVGAPVLATWNPESLEVTVSALGPASDLCRQPCGSRQELYSHYQPRVTEVGSQCSLVSVDVNTAQHS